jgi:hypothetical protein
MPLMKTEGILFPIAQAGHARLESFEVAQIADANSVEVSMTSSDSTIHRQIRGLSQPFPRHVLPK